MSNDLENKLLLLSITDMLQNSNRFANDTEEIKDVDYANTFSPPPEIIDLSHLGLADRTLFNAVCPSTAESNFYYDFSNLLSLIAPNPVRRINGFTKGIINFENNDFIVELNDLAEKSRADIFFSAFIGTLVPSLIKLNNLESQDFIKLFNKELSISPTFIAQESWAKLDSMLQTISDLIDLKIRQVAPLAQQRENIKRLNYINSVIVGKFKYAIIGEALVNNLYSQIAKNDGNAKMALNSFLTAKSVVNKAFDLYIYSNLDKTDEEIVDKCQKTILFNLNSIIMHSILVGR